MSSSFFYLIPLTIGALGVLQASLNRKMTPQIGLAPAICLNATIVFGFALLLLFLAPHLQRWVPFEIAQPAGAKFRWTWWFVLPGLFGLATITGLPLAVDRLGALTSFAILVAGQMVMSLLWDYWTAAMPLTPQRLLSVALACAAVGLQTWK